MTGTDGPTIALLIFAAIAILHLLTEPTDTRSK